MTERNENEVFSEWRSANGPPKAALQEELLHLLSRHAYAVTCIQLQERRPDIVNEAIFRAFRAAPRFRGDSKFSTWFHQIVVNLCKRALRHKILQRTRERSLEDVDVENPTDHFQTMLENLDMEREARNVLNTRDLEFLRLYLNGHKMDEIAALTRMSVGGAKKRLWTIRQKLAREK